MTPQRTARNKADVIFSKLVRAVGRCERCGRVDQLQCAHWLSRRYSNTRTDLDNAFCLCASCHRYFTADPTAWTDWCLDRRGRATYIRLRAAANRPSWVHWPTELERLRAVASTTGVPI